MCVECSFCFLQLQDMGVHVFGVFLQELYLCDDSLNGGMVFDFCHGLVVHMENVVELCAHFPCLHEEGYGSMFM